MVNGSGTRWVSFKRLRRGKKNYARKGITSIYNFQLLHHVNGN